MGLYTEKIKNIVLEAAKIMREAHIERNDITAKEGDGNFVTRYDVAVQEYLIKHLSAAFPDAAFFAEEKEDNVLTDAPTFIIDPIDGTKNFILDYRHSAISVALCERKQAVAAAVYDPYGDELFYAEKGEGAFLLRGNAEFKLAVPPCSLKNAVTTFGTTPYRKADTWQVTSALFAEAFVRTTDMRRSGSAALDLAYVAAGRTNLFFELTLSPWDYAAGLLLVEEAGGVISNEEGRALTFAPAMVVAGSPETHRGFIEEILPAAEARLGRAIHP